MSAHIDEAQLLMLAALSEGDVERVAAGEHMAACASCRALFDESVALLPLLDLAHVPPSIDPALKARIEHGVWSANAPAPSGWSRLMVLLLTLVSLLLVWKNGHPVDPAVAQPAVRCALFESGYALAPLLVGVLLSRFGRVRLSPARFASYTMAFAVLGQLSLRGHCVAHDLSLHLFAFHFLVVLLWGVAGAGTARWLAARV